MSEIEDNLTRAKNLIDASINDLRTTPEKSDISDLLDQVQKLDNYYKRWCEEFDIEEETELGTTYRDGIWREFQIEAEWWHDISLAFRKFRRD